jgi:hypothetical protein
MFAGCFTVENKVLRVSRYLIFVCEQVIEVIMAVIMRVLGDAMPCNLLSNYPDVLEKHAACIPGVDKQATGSSDTSVFAGYTALYTGILIFRLIA